MNYLFIGLFHFVLMCIGNGSWQQIYGTLYSNTIIGVVSIIAPPVDFKALKRKKFDLSLKGMNDLLSLRF